MLDQLFKNDVMSSFIDKIIKQANSLPFMEYDITMCNNGDCKFKDDCHRYIMCQVYKEDKRKDKPRFFSLYKGNSDKCEMFWLEKKL